MNAPRRYSGGRRYHRAPVRMVVLLCLAAAVVAVVPADGARSAPATTRVFFVQGEQLVPVERRRSTLDAAVRALMAGPATAERRRQIRTYILANTPVRSVSVSAGVATIDMGARFVNGTNVDVLLARLSQLVYTATAIHGVTSVRLLVKGGVPLGLFPGVNTAGPLTPRSLAKPDVAPPKPVPEPSTPARRSTRQMQERLAALGYLARNEVDGRLGPATETAVIAFQKWSGLERDGGIGTATRRALTRARRPTPVVRAGAGRRIEVLVDRQLVLAIQGATVVRTIVVSTGKPSTPTPIGSFRVYAEYRRWWSTPFREWLLWAAPFVGGVAMHQFPDVPVYAASHGCVRVTQYDARWLYGFVSVGTPVRVIARSR